MSADQSRKKQEIIKSQDDASRKQVSSKLSVAEKREIIAEQFQGPIPPPDIIGGYEKILPGSADRIIAMAEKQAAHRQDMERMQISAESRDSLLGIISAVTLGVGCLLTAIIMVIFVPTSASAIVASFLGITGIGSITATFLKNTRGNRTNNNSGK